MRRLFDFRIHFAADQNSAVGDIKPQQQHDDAIQLAIGEGIIIHAIEVDASREGSGEPQEERAGCARCAPAPFMIVQVGREAV